MSGIIALHGGGEFLDGDEAFLAAILAAAPSRAGDGVVRVAVVPTAAARGRPGLAAANGVSALTRVAAASGVPVEVAAVSVVDAASAADRGLAERLRGADLIHFPGGDPDLIPTLLRGTPVWAAIVDAWSQGAVLAGASAGAMALGAWTRTPAGGIPGLGLVPGLIVVPHADARSWSSNFARFGASAPAGLAVVGLGERTGVLIGPTGPWRVVGPGEVRWLAPGNRRSDAAPVYHDGDSFVPDESGAGLGGSERT